MEFSITVNNLYAYCRGGSKSPKTGAKGKSVKISLIQAVAENKRYYTRRQLQRAQTTRNLLHALGNPTINDLKAILRLNTIKNCPVTSPDLDVMLRVYGPNPTTVKGKTTHNNQRWLSETLSLFRQS